MFKFEIEDNQKLEEIIDTKFYLILSDQLGWKIHATEKAFYWINAFISSCSFLYQKKPYISHSWIIGTDEDCFISPSDGRWTLYQGKYLTTYINLENFNIITLLKQDCNNIENSNILQMILAFYGIFYCACEFGGLPVHAALLKYHNNGILIPALSGTGKSTCAQRISYPWQDLSDDMALILPDNKGSYYAYPIPTWSKIMTNPDNKFTWQVSNGVPLSGIFFLSQADYDSVEDIGNGLSATKLYSSSRQVMELMFTWSDMEKEAIKRWRERLFFNACIISQSVPSYSLYATLKGSFWKNIENTLISPGIKK